MLDNSKNIIQFSTIALGLIAISSFFPANAQADTSDFQFDKIEVEEDAAWSFNSEDEATSVEDDLQELKEYSISKPDDSDVRLVDEDRLWGNRGNVEDYSLETDIYNY